MPLILRQNEGKLATSSIEAALNSAAGQLDLGASQIENLAAGIQSGDVQGVLQTKEFDSPLECDGCIF